MINLISVVVPVYNGEKTLSQCLIAIFQSNYENYEVIVVDDHSTDRTAQIASGFPCQYIRLNRNQGAAEARNTGAKYSKGQIIFFTDADCLVQHDTLSIIARSFANLPGNTIIGGTYTTKPYDRNVYSCFQSAFVHFSETKHAAKPDYIATHAMAIERDLFNKFPGFNNNEFPILEDVEYSHFMRSNGVKLVINPCLQVQHIFNFSLQKSLKNAIRKSKFWTMYIIKSKGLLVDSGTASYELKANVLIWIMHLALLGLYLITQDVSFVMLILVGILFNLSINKQLINSIYNTYGVRLGLLAIGYYIFVYPSAVTVGSALGVSQHYVNRIIMRGS